MTTRVSKPADAPPTFEADLAFLRKYGDVTVLEAPHGGRVAISAKHQSRVLTCATAPGGASLGWLNRPLIASGKTGASFDNYGGDDRFWLGPEAGPFALFFAHGEPFHEHLWQTPTDVQEGAWAVARASASSATFTRVMSVPNYAGARFELEVERTIRLVNAAEASPWLADANWVAFESVNKITNRGDAPWTKSTGLPCIWILGQFEAAPDARVVIPYHRDADGEVVNDRYFGKVPSDRLTIDPETATVAFKVDAQYRSKIGMSPARTTGVLASYSAASQVLTIAQTPQPDKAKPYVDYMWESPVDPFRGDAINAYNDGPPKPGTPPLAGFYELETSSPAAALNPGESITHTHSTLRVIVDAKTKAALLAAPTFPVDPRALF